MFNIINLQNNTMFYSSNSNPLNKLSQKYTNTSSSKTVWGGGAMNSLFYKGLCHDFNINNMTISSSFRYNYL